MQQDVKEGPSRSSVRERLPPLSPTDGAVPPFSLFLEQIEDPDDADQGAESDTFGRLLRKLHAEHRRRIAELQKENRRLREDRAGPRKQPSQEEIPEVTPSFHMAPEKKPEEVGDLSEPAVIGAQSRAARPPAHETEAVAPASSSRLRSSGDGRPEQPCEEPSAPRPCYRSEQAKPTALALESSGEESPPSAPRRQVSWAGLPGVPGDVSPRFTPTKAQIQQWERNFKIHSASSSNIEVSQNSLAVPTRRRHSDDAVPHERSRIRTIGAAGGEGQQPQLLVQTLSNGPRLNRSPVRKRTQDSHFSVNSRSNSNRSLPPSPSERQLSRGGIGSNHSYPSEEEEFDGEFRPRAMWRPPAGHTSILTRRLTAASTRMLDSPSNGFKRSNSVTVKTINQWEKMLFHPSSTGRVWWDVTSMVLLAYDTVMIPMEAFHLPMNWFLRFMDWCTLLFWTIDMPMSLLTGIVRKGETIMRPGPIFVNYCKTWFVLDLIIVVPDWAFTIMELAGSQGGSSGNAGKLLRSLRIVRMARVLRLAKLKRVLNLVKDKIQSEMMFIVVGILKLVVCLLIVNHFIAAGWYFIGDLGMNSPEWGTNWVEAHYMEDGHVVYLYFTSLHWSLTQFTPASMDVQPVNVTERAFAVFVLVFGLVLFSSFVSSITASMTQLRNMQGEMPKQFWLLRRYMRQHHVHNELTFRILRYAEHASAQEKNLVPESRLWILERLSDQLRQELTYVVTFKCLTKHPLFCRIQADSDQCMHRLAGTVLYKKQLAVGDTLFKSGTEALSLYFIANGNIEWMPPLVGSLKDLQEKPRDRISQETATRLQTVEKKLAIECTKGDWLSEATLWTRWEHIGNAKAMDEVSLVCVEPEPFAGVVRLDPRVWEVVIVYAQIFCEILNDEDGNVKISEKMTDVGTVCTTDERLRGHLALKEGMDVNATSSAPLRRESPTVMDSAKMSNSTGS